MQGPLSHAVTPPLNTQAEARQRQFESSATGRAAIKSVKNAQAEKQQAQRRAENDTARDWLN